MFSHPSCNMVYVGSFIYVRLYIADLSSNIYAGGSATHGTNLERGAWSLVCQSMISSRGACVGLSGVEVFGSILQAGFLLG